MRKREAVDARQPQDLATGKGAWQKETFENLVWQKRKRSRVPGQPDTRNVLGTDTLAPLGTV